MSARAVYPVICVFASLVAAAVPALPVSALERNVLTTERSNMRVGPSEKYRVVTTILDNQIVTVHGCVRNYSWCDVSWAEKRGWVSASLLHWPGMQYGFAAAAEGLGIPEVKYVKSDYMATHYPVRAEPAGIEFRGPLPLEEEAVVVEAAQVITE